MAKKRVEPHEEHADETWLIPYSDLLTLLLALFIVLFASSQIDQKKFEDLRYSLNIAFSGATTIFDKERAIEAPNQPDTENTVRRPEVPTISQPSFNVLPILSKVDEKTYMRETAQLIEIKKKMDEYIRNNHLESSLSTNLTDAGLMIRIRETALFPSGSAQLRPDAKKLAEQIARMIAPINQEITVSGHTDNQPIHTREFPSNWELSAIRAVNFTSLILGQDSKIAPQRFRTIGYGEYRPVAKNDAEEGRAANRRVEIFIMRNYKP